MVGNILLAQGDLPDGWLPCDGTILQAADYAELFQLIGNAYGGDGEETFAVPDLAPVDDHTYYAISTG